MNRVFKVIWNRTKSCYVVVAETAKNMTKRPLCRLYSLKW